MSDDLVSKRRAERCTTHSHACDCREYAHAKYTADLLAEIERLWAEVEGLRARIEEATVGRVGIQGWMHVKRQELHGKRVALVPLND